jgi:hypothetical protein
MDAHIRNWNTLARTSDVRSLRSTYERMLKDRPCRSCDCLFCERAGVNALVFRGINRNKRRGAHNTLMLYGKLKERS